MDSILSCNLASYGTSSNEALSHLSALGVRYVEIPAPAPEQVENERARLASFGLSAATVVGHVAIGDERAGELFEPVAAAAQAMGAKVIFASVQAGDVPLPTAYDRLRAVGDVCQSHGVSLAMETHPDLCANGDQMVQTMQAIDHVGVGINFDTANIYYYNEGIDAVTEVSKALPWVRSVHLKDTMGGFHEHNFPAIGSGVVDYPAFFTRLRDRGFKGPYTLELEGVAGVTRSFAERCQEVSDSVAYLRRSRLISAWPAL